MVTALLIDNTVDGSEEFIKQTSNDVLCYMFYPPVIGQHTPGAVPIPDNIKVERLGIVCDGTSFLNTYIEKNLEVFLGKHRELRHIDFFASNTLTKETWTKFYENMVYRFPRLQINASSDETGKLIKWKVTSPPAVNASSDYFNIDMLESLKRLSRETITIHVDGYVLHLNIRDVPEKGGNQYTFSC